MPGLISIRRPYTDDIFSGVKLIEWRKSPLPLQLYYVYESKSSSGCGKVIGEFRVSTTNSFSVDTLVDCPEILRKGAVSLEHLKAYSKTGIVCANYLTNVIRYKTPVDLEEFTSLAGNRIIRPPQNWCSVSNL